MTEKTPFENMSNEHSLESDHLKKDCGKKKWILGLKTLTIYENAIQRLDRLEKPMLLTSAQMHYQLGILREQTPLFFLAIESYKNAIKILRAEKKEHKQVYQKIKNHLRAHQMVRKLKENPLNTSPFARLIQDHEIALKYLKEQKRTSFLSLAHVYYSLAQLWKTNKHKDHALYYHQKALNALSQDLPSCRFLYGQVIQKYKNIQQKSPTPLQ